MATALSPHHTPSPRARPQRGLARRPASPTTPARTAARATPTPARPSQPSLPTLYDVPVSNYCARVRHVLYAKGLVEAGAVALAHPSALGGLQSEAYRALNPHSKMPLWHLPAGTRLPAGPGSPEGDVLYEADAIVRYVVAKWRGVGPSFEPPSPEAAGLSDLAIKVMDTYIFPHQGCMYKAMDAPSRAAGLAALAAELEVLEGLLSGGPHAVGDTLTPADASLYPTLLFCDRILPSQFGWEGLWEKRPRLGAHFRHMSGVDPAGVRVTAEMDGGLAGWAAAEGGGRWSALGIADQVRADPGAFRH